MCYHSKRLVLLQLAAVLTYLCGVGAVKVWQGFTPFEAAGQGVEINNHRGDSAVETPQIPEQSDVCKEVGKFSGGYASNNNPVFLGILNGKACLVEPDYPQKAVEKGLSGTVNVEVLIDGFGKLQTVNAVSGPVELRASAVESARKAVFRPVYLRGEPVRAKGILVYRFALPE